MSSVRPSAADRRRALAPAAAALLLAGLLVLTGCSSAAKPTASSSEPPLGFRSAPSYLPTAAPVDRVVTATPTHPQLAIQGVAVQTVLPAGHVLAMVTGPTVPPFVAPPPERVTATFDVSLTHVSGTVPVRLSDFTITDQLGRTFHPSLVVHETAPPATISAGQTVDLRVTAVMPTGEGRIYWSPTHGTPFVGWDFVVEND